MFRPTWTERDAVEMVGGSEAHAQHCCSFSLSTHESTAERRQLKQSTAMAMYDIPNCRWCFIHLHCLLVASLVASSSPSSDPVSVSSAVGSQVVLPCSWKSRLDDTSLPACSVQWQSPPRVIVFEQKGLRSWQATEFMGRTAVPQERLGVGDCSLVLSDVQFADEGFYESFMLVNGARTSKRIFIQTVRLSVHDHKSKATHAPGEVMVLKLHTSKSMRVVFQGSNSAEWSGLWMRGDENTHRLEKNEQQEELTLRGLRREDEGDYKVLDAQGLAISTIQLHVTEASDSEKVPLFLDEQEPVGKATGTTGSLLTVLSLSFSSLILHLL